MTAPKVSTIPLTPGVWLAGILAMVFGLLGTVAGIYGALTFITDRSTYLLTFSQAVTLTLIAGVGAAVSLAGLTSGWWILRGRVWALRAELFVALGCIACVSALSAVVLSASPSSGSGGLSVSALLAIVVAIYLMEAWLMFVGSGLHGRHWPALLSTPTHSQAGNSPPVGDAPPLREGAQSRLMLKVLLACGILSGIFYACMDAIGGLQWTHYSWISEEFSRLSAVGAPSRWVILDMCPIYTALVVAFAVGLFWWSRGKGRGLRVISIALIAYAAANLVWPQFYPENMSQSVGAFTNTMHIVITGVVVTTWLAILGVATASYKGWLRFYSIGTIGVVLVFGGGLAGWQGALMAAGQPHPWLGLVERINIHGFYAWMAVLGVVSVREVQRGTRTASLPVVERHNLPRPEALATTR